MRQAKVYVHNKFAGIITESDSPRKYTFQYDSDYIEQDESVPVCLGMPIRKEIYVSDYLFPYFANLTSEGENRSLQASFLKLDKDDDFGFLLETAGHDTVGAVTVIKM